jgi:hypothetical protein
VLLYSAILLNAILMIAILLSAPLKCHSVECHSIECHFIRWHSAESHSIECHSIECHSIECHFIRRHSAESHSIECHFIECHSVECHFIECHSVECHFIRCHSAESHSIECHFIRCHSAESHVSTLLILKEFGAFPDSAPPLIFPAVTFKRTDQGTILAKTFLVIYNCKLQVGGPVGVAQWVEHSTHNPKFEGSNPDPVCTEGKIGVKAISTTVRNLVQRPSAEHYVILDVVMLDVVSPVTYCHCQVRPSLTFVSEALGVFQSGAKVYLKILCLEKL